MTPTSGSPTSATSADRRRACCRTMARPGKSNERRIRRRFRARYARLQAAISVRFPLIWRTRLIGWLVFGMALAGLAAAYGRTGETNRETLIGLHMSVVWLRVAELAPYAGLLILVLDTSRRVG